MSVPQILIASTVDGKSSAIAKNMGAEFLSKQDNVEYYTWTIDNKYYTSQVLLHATEDESFDFSANGIEALILHHDPEADNAEEKLTHWLPIISSLAEIDILLLSCDHIGNSVIREKVLEWCSKRKFELVELEREDSTDNSECDMGEYKYGIERIIEALHAHMWPNMILKGKPDVSDDENVQRVEEQLENIRLTQDPMERLQMESVLDGIMGGENADFGELFSQLMAMKEHAASLPTHQRRIAAEQLVKAFWKGMGGDPSEMED